MFKETKNDEEIMDILEIISRHTGDLDSYINDHYEKIIFLGRAGYEDDLDTTNDMNLTCELCRKYYFLREDYIKLKQLNDLIEKWNSPQKVTIDRYIIDTLVCNAN